MVKKTSHSHHGKKISFDKNGIHFAELLELALDEPQDFDFLLECFKYGMQEKDVLKLIEQLI